MPCRQEVDFLIIGFFVDPFVAVISCYFSNQTEFYLFIYTKIIKREIKIQLNIIEKQQLVLMIYIIITLHHNCRFHVTFWRRAQAVALDTVGGTRIPTNRPLRRWSHDLLTLQNCRNHLPKPISYTHTKNN